MKVKGKEMIQDLNLQNRKKRREEAVDKILNNLDYDPINKEKGQFVLELIINIVSCFNFSANE